MLVISPTGIYSKHYYIGSQRIASRVGDGTATIFEGGGLKSAETETSTSELDALKLRQQQDLLYYAAKAGIKTVEYAKYDTPDLSELTEESTLKSAAAVPTYAIYYYHPDHLGSNTLITNTTGVPYQLYLNLPFGETMAEQTTSTGTYQSPYKFNSKELDAETGLYYYGARYYDPKSSVWLSVDPMAVKYPSLSPYNYCANNPINAIDPNGEVVIFINGQHGGSGGNPSYWGGLDQRIANRFQDYHARYYDGAMGGWKNTILAGVIFNNLLPGNRMRAGKAMGYNQAKDIYSSLSSNETIKIATHSMGGAYGKGFVKGLKKYAQENGLNANIERVLDLATFQGSALKSEKGILNEQIAHTNDGVAGVSRVEGVSNENFHETRQQQDSGGLNEHSVDSFTMDELNKSVKPGSPSTAKLKPQDGKIIIDFQQNK